jgi:hypothetical protein
MPKIQIDLDAVTTEALSSLAGARGTTPADLVAEIVGKYVHVPAQDLQPDPPERKPAPPDSIDALVGRYDAERYASDPPDALDALVGSIDADPDDGYRAPPDAMDELVGRYHGERINDIDEVVYGR